MVVLASLYIFPLIYVCLVASSPLLKEAELDILSKHSPLLLNIGGITPAVGWVNVNVQYDNVLHEMEQTDVILRNMSDLHGIPDGSVALLYSSHTLEHVSTANGDVLRTLREWRRVVRYGGLVMVAVPDLVMLARLYAEESYPPYVHEGIVPILYGGQRDQYDFHISGFDERLLRRLMDWAGFCTIERVENFNAFPLGFDASDSYIVDIPISLNLVARPCLAPGVETDGFLIGHQGSQYEKERYILPKYDPTTNEFMPGP